MSSTVAVIGLGPLGLIAMKTFKEDGYQVTGFEKRGYVGGLWKQSQDSALSVTESTVFNSSRFRSAMSDFPFPKATDDYPTAPQVHQYMEDYCDHFGLRPQVRLNAEVKSFERVKGRWALHFEQGGSARTEYFDKLLLSSGSFVIPRAPKVKDLDKFQGTVLHSLNFPYPSKFKDQNVLLIGLHATAQDLTVELSGHAKKVYIAHKNGAVLLPRFGPDGRAFDEAQSVSFFFIQVFMSTWFPRLWNWVLDKLLAMMSKKAFPYQPKEWKLSPAPSIATTAPMIADEIYPFMKSGYATPVAAIQQILGPKSVRFTDGRVVDDIDAIVYCTGYETAVPYVLAEYNPYPVADKPPYLYRNIFPLHADADVRNSLAFMGHGGIPYPGFVQWELTAMAISQTWAGRSPLPPLRSMQRWHDTHLAWRRDIVSRSKFDSNFYVFFLNFPDHVRWLDATAGTGIFEHFSFFSLRAWRFWWSDPAFYKLCKTGLFSPAIWRLFDMGRRKPWAGAKKQVIEDNEFADSRQAQRAKAMKMKEEEEAQTKKKKKKKKKKKM